MSDEKPENQEFYSANEVNDFHSSASARELSASTSTSETTETTETTTVSTAAPVTAGVITTGAVATAAVTVGVLSGTPLLTNLPKVEQLQSETTSTSVSYSFQCTYVSAGSLIVRLTSATETKDNSYDLVVPTAESSTPSGLKKAEATSSAADSSDVPVSSSSSSSSTSYSKLIEGSFAGLLPNTNYALTILSSFTSNSLTTLKTETLATPEKPTIVPGKMDFASAAIDDVKGSFDYTVSVTDPSSTFDKTSYNLQIAGKGLDGLDHTTTNPISDITANQSLSLTSFKGSQSLTFSLMAISSYAAEGETAKTTSQVFASKNLYYAGVQGTMDFTSSAIDSATKTFTYHVGVTDPDAVFDATSYTLQVKGKDLSGSAVVLTEPISATASDLTYSLSSFKASQNLTFDLLAVSSYHLENETAKTEKQSFKSLTLYYAGTQGAMSFAKSVIDNAAKSFTYNATVTDLAAALDPTSYELSISGNDLTGAAATTKSAITALGTDQTVSLSSFQGSQSLTFSLSAVSSYAAEGDTPSTTKQIFATKILYYAGIAPTASFTKSVVDNAAETFTYQLSVTDSCALLLKESLTIYVNGTDKAGSPLIEQHAVDLTASGDQSFSIANFKGSQSLSLSLQAISSYAAEGETPSKEPVVLTSLTPYYAGAQAVIAFVSSTVDYTTSTLSYSISVTDPSSVLDTTSVYLIAANSDSSITQKGTFSGSITDTQTLSLSAFTKGNFLRLSIWGISSYAKEGDTAPSTAQKFVEKALYY
jgi:hypothetical protein